jgi:hypothetical protein
LILLSSSFALFVGGDSLLNSLRDRLVALAAHQARPTKHYLREFTAGGGLMSYGASISGVKAGPRPPNRSICDGRHSGGRVFRIAVREPRISPEPGATRKERDMRKIILIWVLAMVAAILFFSKPTNSNVKKAEIGIGGGVELPMRMMGGPGDLC